MESILLLLIVVLVMRWMVWRVRLGKLNDKIGSLESRLLSLEKKTEVSIELQKTKSIQTEKSPRSRPAVVPETIGHPSSSDTPIPEPVPETPVVALK